MIIIQHNNTITILLLLLLLILLIHIMITIEIQINILIIIMLIIINGRTGPGTTERRLDNWTYDTRPAYSTCSKHLIIIT